ncbi:MAG TPA: alpha/beta hydrolase [Mycobacterium sp.]|uniref:alpha/beta hydrolase n=1 Tax=Mycobacterium sp. TaxID=1785 RepID=UPI002C6D3BC9|nr:alpha/beta hydrolase [Mycobacterium sp.]HME78311.1 alpha/beta hydrolase [Mycobacterium sp.]
MPLRMDPEVFARLRRSGPIGEPGPPVGDVESRRKNLTAGMAAVAASRQPMSGIDRTDVVIAAGDGAELRVSWYTNTTVDPPGSAVLYLHGGGFIVPLLPIYDDMMREYTKRSGVPMLLVDYRVAPEHPHPTPVDDCYAALCWLANSASELDVDPKRIAVMGESAGGGLAAGVALMARDRGGPALAQQLLIYAMLDDRTVGPDPQLPPEYLVFGYDDNQTGWGALLGAAWRGDDVSPYAAPARATDLSGLPETYVDVGDLDILRDENIEYARRLMAAGIPTELHVVPGLPHGFEMAAPDAAATQRVMAHRLRRLKRL